MANDMNNPAPCKGCTNRHPACHDGCEKYKEWKVKLEARKEAEKIRKGLGHTNAWWRYRRKSYNKNISPEFEKYSS